MRFRYVCSDCGRVFETEGLMYQCPECAAANDGTHFPKGNLIVELVPPAHYMVEDTLAYSLRTLRSLCIKGGLK